MRLIGLQNAAVSFGRAPLQPVHQNFTYIEADMLEVAHRRIRAIGIIYNTFIPIAVRRSAGFLADVASDRVTTRGLLKMAMDT